MSTPCATNLINEFPGTSAKEAEELLLKIRNIAIEKAAQNGGNMQQALEYASQMLQQWDKYQTELQNRGALLNAQKLQENLDYIQRYPRVGDGIVGKLVGSKFDVVGGRDSIALQLKNLDHGYFGRLTAEMEEAGVFREFHKNQMVKDIYIETGELKPDGKPGVTGNKKAKTIANILDKIRREMNARLARAGAPILELPGYVDRQTHDMSKIRAAGENQGEARRAWETFVLPLIDHEKTFLGVDKAKFLLNVHNSLYSGVPGVLGMEAEYVGHKALANKWQQPRVLFFKDAESAFKYNERFGTKDLKQQVMTDINNKARSIALMENLGVNPDAGIENLIAAAKNFAKESADPAAQMTALDEVKIRAAYNQLTGVNDIPANPTLARTMGNIRATVEMAKMGAVSIANLFTDRVFLQSDATFQGIKHLQMLGAQVTAFAKRSPDSIKRLRLMGVGIDGLIGSALSRYQATGPVSGPIQKFRKIFYDINFSNYLTDTAKSAYADVMSAHLGNHAELNFTDLPADLKKVLKLYDITAPEWNLIRSTAYDHQNGAKLITPDQLKNISDAEITKLWKGEKPPNPEQIQTLRDRLESQLRGYFIDRVDYGIPTPGAAERALATLDTQSGTGLGEAVRLIMLFKSFPITIANKVLTRGIYGNGATSVKDFVLNDHAGKFHLAQLIAMTTIAGYLGMSIRDALRGRTPRALTTDDGNVNWDVLQDAMVQGGGLGIMGEMLARDYQRGIGSFLENAAGPALGQLDKVAEMKTKLTEGKDISPQLVKLALDNTPLLNLFYLRPILNYYVFWNLQEMMTPGSLRKIEKSVRQQNQDFFITPSETIK